MPIAKRLEGLEAFGSVDIFVMNAVIEHLLDVDQVLTFAKDNLKAHGILVVATMDYGRGFIRKNIDNLRVHARPLTQHLNPVEHVNIYDYDSIGRTLSKHGFEWIGTDRVMAWANCPIPFLKNTRTIIRFLNAIEWVISRLDRNRELDIKVYASKTSLF